MANAPIQLLLPSLITFNNTPITEHNRQPLRLGVNRIEDSIRTAGGRLRKRWVADKFTIDVSWEMVPTRKNETVDGLEGGAYIEGFYYNTPSNFRLTTWVAGERRNWDMVFTDYNRTTMKRFQREFWNIDLSMEEV